MHAVWHKLPLLLSQGRGTEAGKTPRQGRHLTKTGEAPFISTLGRAAWDFRLLQEHYVFTLPDTVTHVRTRKPTSHAGHSSAVSRPVKAIPREQRAFGSVPRSCQ